jgi:hypothetical protein
MTQRRIIDWHRVANSSESYRYERDGIRATYGDYNDEGGKCFWTVNDCHDVTKDMVTGDAETLLAARINAEDTARRLQRTRGETPAMPLCCYESRTSADWDEGPGGVLYCPTCKRAIAQFRQK